MRKVLLLLATLYPATSMAESYICENPRREYLLTYERDVGSVFINPDSDQVEWPIVSVVRDDARHILVVDLGRKGMAANVHLRPTSKVEIFSNGEIIQTDGCHASNGQSSVAPTFSSFNEETEALGKLLKCGNPKLTRTPGLPDLWGCVEGSGETVKVFVNANTEAGVENVKLMWNDWTRDAGYGLHADQPTAYDSLELLVERYVPGSAGEALKAFSGNLGATFRGPTFTVSYTFNSGPSIDERMIVVTEN